MSRYTLRTFYFNEEIERFTGRSGYKLKEILNHSRYDQAGQTGPFGEELKNPNRYEIFDSLSIKVFQGNISETRVFVKGLR